MWRRRPESQPLSRSPALDLLAVELDFENKPYLGADYGELITPETPAPLPPPPEPIEIPKPDWLGADSVPDPGTVAEATPVSALAAMRLEDDGFAPLEIPGPPVRNPPVPRIQLPEPDWREVEREERALAEAEAQRLSREARAQLLEEILAEHQTAYPAKRKQQS